MAEPEGGYFLKRSILIRTKDQVRHFFLPQRRWAEWRNFHRLHAARIAVSSPVLRAENIDRYPKFFSADKGSQWYTFAV